MSKMKNWPVFLFCFFLVCPPFYLVQYDFVELLDGSRLISKDKRALGGREEEPSGGGARHARSVNVHEAGFIQYLDTGIWHLAFYNDGRSTEQLSYNAIVIGESHTHWLTVTAGYSSQ